MNQNHDLSSLGIGLVASNDPRLVRHSSGAIVICSPRPQVKQLQLQSQLQPQLQTQLQPQPQSQSQQQQHQHQHQQQSHPKNQTQQQSPTKNQHQQHQSLIKNQHQQQQSPPKNQIQVPKAATLPKSSKRTTNNPLADEKPFSWETYLNITGAKAAPPEAFMQSMLPMKNNFEIGMKLEARDPRNPTSWCLASVLRCEGLRLRLRFEGSDGMNDFCELIDSDNIRQVTGEILYPPMAFKGNIVAYPKFVEKILSRDDTILAPAEYFNQPPLRPKQNLFEKGMKLEAIDRKHAYLICPATIGEVNGQDVTINFDGWRGSFDYTCKYYSRDLFPVNWCHKTGHFLTAPNNWAELAKKPLTPTKEASKKATPTSEPPAKKKLKTRPKVVRPHQSILKKEKTEKKTCKNVVRLEEPDSDDSDETIDKFQCRRNIPYPECLPEKSRLKPKHRSSAKKVDLSPPAPEVVLITDSASSTNASSQESCSIPTFPSSTLNIEKGADKPKKLKVEIKNELSRESGIKTYDLMTVEDIKEMIVTTDQSLSKVADILEDNEIDGRTFIKLNREILNKDLGIKMGPALKIIDLIEQVKRRSDHNNVNTSETDETPY